MFRLISILILLLPLSCVSEPVSNQDLYHLYAQLSKSTSSGEVVGDREKYFTPKYLSDVNVTEKKSLFVLKLTKYIDSIETQYQKIDSNSGCLTINGIDKEKSPVSLFVEYKKINSNWLVNYMYLNFIESKKEFINKAICPRDIEALKHNKTH